MLIDSHCHLVFRQFDDDLQEVVARWREAGVGAVIHACVEPAEIPAMRQLADQVSELRYAVGVHPLDTQKWESTTAAVLREAARADARVVAVGEMGLERGTGNRFPPCSDRRAPGGRRPGSALPWER
jgi:TatD DNase family protein